MNHRAQRRQNQLSGCLSLWQDFRKTLPGRGGAATTGGQVSGAEMLPPGTGVPLGESNARPDDPSYSDVTLPPHNGTRTSRAAAAAAVPSIAHQEAVVVRAVRESADGLTREEIARTAGLMLASVCARVNSLIREGILREHGERKTRSNRAAAIVRVNGTA